MKETIEQFLARGGKIKVIRSRADEIAANVIPTGRYCQKDAYIKALIEIKNRSSKGKRVNFRKKSFPKR